METTKYIVIHRPQPDNETNGAENTRKNKSDEQIHFSAIPSGAGFCP